MTLGVGCPCPWIYIDSGIQPVLVTKAAVPLPNHVNPALRRVGKVRVVKGPLFVLRKGVVDPGARKLATW